MTSNLYSVFNNLFIAICNGNIDFYKSLGWKLSDFELILLVMYNIRFPLSSKKNFKSRNK